MYKKALIASLLLAWTTAAFAATSAPQAGSATTPSQTAVDAAKYAVATYRNDVVDTLARLVSFNTVADARYPSDKNPVHIAFKAALKQEAERLGLDYADHGWTVIVGLGKGSERVGIVTHGDVQPVDPTKWKKSPFVLDRTSEPGKLIARGAAQEGMRYTFERQGANLKVVAKGLSAHSSKPQEGVNAVSMLADALAVRNWPNTVAGGVVNYLNDLVGTGYHGEKFGKIAYRDSFMGPMTFKPTVIRQLDEGIEVAINVRRPRGKTTEQLTSEIQAALADWQARRVPLVNVKVGVREPWILENAPQVPTLLSTFSYFTGMKDAKPVAIGGGTNSRLFPNAVSFGPSMPGAKYTGHSEHEFITTRQLLLNLQMYTAVLVELAK